MYSQILQACLELRLFEILAPGPLALPILAGRLGLSTARAERLLDAASALQLVDKRHGRLFGLGPLGAALVDNPGVAAMVAHHAMLYADLADPVALLRDETPTTRLRAYWAYANAQAAPEISSDASRDYTALMAASQALVAGEILGAYKVAQHRCLMDVGGGDGSFLCGAADHAPATRLILFDLPPVAACAQARFAASGLAARASAIGGSFLTDTLPHGADLISLIRVVHDHDDESVRTLLGAIRQALPPDGTLLLAEPMAETPGASRMGHAYFGLYLLAMGQGRPRSAAELTGFLHEAGFSRVRIVPTPTPLLVTLLLADCKP